MDCNFFERYSSRLKVRFDENTVIKENDKLGTLNEKGMSRIIEETLEKTKPSHSQFLESLSELNVCPLSFFMILYTYKLNGWR